MALSDKVQNAAQQAGGRIKEAVGERQGNEDLAAEGRNDQSKAKVKKVGEDVKDVFK